MNKLKVTRFAASWRYPGRCCPVNFVKQTGQELVTLDLFPGLWPAATHSAQQPLKYRRESDPGATSSPAHTPACSLLLTFTTALTQECNHSRPSTSFSSSSSSPPPPPVRSMRQLRPQRPSRTCQGALIDLEVSAATPGRGFAARFRPEKPISEERLEWGKCNAKSQRLTGKTRLGRLNWPFGKNETQGCRWDL